MNKHIIISSTTANRIRGEHGEHSAVDPIALGDGKYIVPEECLTDNDLAEIISLIPDFDPRKTIEEIKVLYPEFQKNNDFIR